MSDIEILLRELSDKIDDLNNKLDRILEQNKPFNVSIETPWGDDSTPLPLRHTEEIETERQLKSS